MRIVSHFLAALLILTVSCSSPDSNGNDDSRPKKESAELTSEVSEEMTSETEIVEIIVDTFKGQWFKIDYPLGFTVSPTSPTDIFNDYEYVTTDEATFTSPDETVQFFVYSPQWSGDPKSYLRPTANEKIASDKTTVDEIDPSRSYRWITFEDKKGEYIRSVYSKKSDLTHLVFGIKYSDQEIYEMYKDSYAAFKKSLVQYAD